MPPLVSFTAPPRRVLIVKPSAIGDVVHTIPIWNLLRRHWPEARLSWVVTPACGGLLEGLAGLEVIRFERRRWASAWRDRAVRQELARFSAALREREFDLAIDLQGLFRSAWIVRQTKAPVRIGFANARELAPLFYTHRVHVGHPEQHAIDRYRKVLAALGVPDGPIEFPFAVSDDDRSFVAKLLPPGPFAVLLPGTNWPTKRWPVERFASLVEPLARRFGLASVVAGGPDDRALAAGISGAIDLTGRTTLPQLVALLERATLVVANDSGPMHIAAALGRPLVAPFGPTNPVRTGPYGREGSVVRLDLPCSPCYSRSCSHQSCLRWLEIEPVLELAQRQMEIART